MLYKNIVDKHVSTFKRLVGLPKFVFKKMVKESIRNKPISTHKIIGKIGELRPKLSDKDMVLMLLMYYRGTELIYTLPQHLELVNLGVGKSLLCLKKNY